MNLYQELLISVLEKQEMTITFANGGIDINKLAEQTACQLLEKIKTVLSDDTLADSECFAKIEAIVSLLENEGITCGNRHDFG